MQTDGPGSDQCKNTDESDKTPQAPVVGIQAPTSQPRKRKTNAIPKFKSMDEARIEYNRNRKVEIRNVCGITEMQVKELVGEYETVDINVSQNQKYHNAIVLLSDVTQSDQLIAKLNGSQFHSWKLELQYFPRKRLLCISGLPPDMTDAAFQNLVDKHGKPDLCFVMRTNKGINKGYGFIEYNSKSYDEVVQIRRQLEGQVLSSGHTLRCQFLRQPSPTFDELQSTCLHVTNLPEMFGDDERLLEDFSSIGDPTFCRVARRDDLPVGFAIVEYAEACLAEESWIELQGLDIDGHKVVIQMCVPGETVTDIHSKLLNTNVKNCSEKTNAKLERSERDVSQNGSRSTCSKVSVAVDNQITCLLETRYQLVLGSLKRLLQQLQRYHSHQLQQQHQQYVAGTVESNLHQFRKQLAILAAHLASLAQQLLPQLTNSMLLKVLPPDTNLVLLSSNPSVTEATLLIQRMISDISFDLTEEDHDTIESLESLRRKNLTSDGIKSRQTPDTGKTRHCSTKQENVATDRYKYRKRKQDGNMKSSEGLKEVTGLPEQLLGETMQESVDEVRNTLTNIDQLFCRLQDALRDKECQKTSQRKKDTEDGLEKNGKESRVEKLKSSETEEDVSKKPGLLGEPPPVLVAMVKLSKRPVFLPCTVLASYLESAMLERILRPVDVEVPEKARLPVVSMSGVIHLFHLPLIRPLISKFCPKILHGTDVPDGRRIESRETTKIDYSKTGTGMEAGPTQRLLASRSSATGVLAPRPNAVGGMCHSGPRGTGRGVARWPTGAASRPGSVGQGWSGSVETGSHSVWASQQSRGTDNEYWSAAQAASSHQQQQWSSNDNGSQWQSTSNYNMKSNQTAVSQSCDAAAGCYGYYGNSTAGYDSFGQMQQPSMLTPPSTTTTQSYNYNTWFTNTQQQQQQQDYGTYYR